MQSWTGLIADVNKWLDCNFDAGRGGHDIECIVLHHNGGNLSIQGCFNALRGNGTSAHYQIDAAGIVGQFVHDWDTAWHAGNYSANQRSIGIEHANNNSSPWTISDATLEAGAHLVAALCVYYGLGAPRWLVNVFPHNYFAATACPGEIAGSQHTRYMERAAYWYSQMTGNAASVEAVSVTAPPVLSMADEGETIRGVQTVLNTFFPEHLLSVDGVFGENTHRHVQAFQTLENLDVDGIIGDDTRAAFKRHGHSV